LVCCCSEIAQFSAKFPQIFVPYHHKIKYFSAQSSQNFVVKWHKIFCRILAKFSGKNPHIFFDFVVVWHKILRGFGRKLCDFQKNADQIFFHRTNVFFILSVLLFPSILVSEIFKFNSSTGNWKESKMNL
jgi:hypothetical protein